MLCILLVHIHTVGWCTVHTTSNYLQYCTLHLVKFYYLHVV